MIRFFRMVLSAVALLFIAPMMNANPAPDKDGHALTALWKQYEEASKADRPQKEAEILEKIKTEAQKQHLPADFYDAATKYVDVVQRRDWKKVSEARANLKKEVLDFNDPLVTFLWMGDTGSSSDERWAFVRDRSKVFREGHNTALYRGVESLMDGILKNYMESDYEYALWRLLGYRPNRLLTSDDLFKALEAEVAGKYPAEGYLAYYAAARQSDRALRKEALETLVKKYAPRAVSFWPRMDLLQIEYETLNEKKDDAASYRALYDKCVNFEKDRNALIGEESRIARGCNTAKNLTKTLTAKDLDVRVLGKQAVVTFRNLDKATLTLLEDKTKLKTWNLTNPTRSFYVKDTVKVDLPELGDGSYSVEAVNGKISDIGWYNQHTLSLAVRRQAGGYAAYVTDYISGKPLDKVTLVLSKGDREVASETVRMDGFTLLPKKMADILAKNKDTYYSLTASTGSGKGLRASEALGINTYWYDRDDDSDRDEDTYCRIFKDRGAYNPGDVLQFKAVVYKGNLIDKVSVVPDKALEAVLTDSEGNELNRLKLKTNEFGSVSGTFTLPVGLRNGYFGIHILSGKSKLASDSFRVDEFVLPTFSLSFDPNDRLYLKGDEVKITGKVKSYSGHALSGANLAVKVTRWGNVILEQDVKPAEDGTFEIAFPAEETGYHNVEVTVTDATGEMQEFGTGVYVSDHINVSLSMENAAEGEFTTMDEKDNAPVRYIGRRWRYGPSNHILAEDVARVKMQVNNSDGIKIDVPVTYTLYAEDSTVVRTGKAASGEVVAIDLKDVPDGLYSLHAEASERNAEDKEDIKILKLSPDGTVLDAPVRRVFVTGPEDVPMGEKIRLTIGTADGAEYAIVTLFGKGRQVLETRKIVLKGVRGKAGSLETVELDYKADYPDAVRLQVFYFKRGEAITFDKEYSRSRTRLSLPLQFDRFTDNAFPGTKYTFTLKTDTGVEALAAVFDKSIDAIGPNYWNVVTLRNFSVPYVSVDSVCGEVNGDDPYEDELELEESAIPMAKSTGVPRMMATRSVSNEAVTGAAANVALGETMYDAVMDEADMAPGSAPDDVAIRSKFETALTFQPHLVSDAAGNLSFTFETSDKLSTYYVQVYAHDKGMRNIFLRQEMVVSVPVKVAVVEPKFLYVGDTYEMAVSVASNTDKPVSGQLYLYVYPSGEHEAKEAISVQRVAVTVPAGGTESHRFAVRVPDLETIGFKAVFAADDFSDAVFLPVPVQKPVQTLTEAHSAVLRAGMDRETLLAELRARFVNVPASAAELTETTLLDLVRASIPAKVDPEGKDVLSLSEAYYSRLLAGRIGKEIPVEDLLDKILACRNADGGFGWFEGMNSSAVITAVLLNRFAKLRDHGFDVPDLTSSVKFLDKNHFTMELPYWRGYLSDAQYMFIRSLYPSVKFEEKPVTKESKKRMEDFQKYAKSYLVPSAKDGRGLQGQIMAKARRVQTLLNLSATSDGVALAKAWGVKVAAKVKMEASLKADIASLKEYAVEHRDGGWYYPNAVMPWRGLLETEADAHALLCNLMQPYAPNISDGIRLWLMLQKESQKWDESPAFVDAITAILDGSDEVLATSILSYSATYEKPFSEIKAAGNGFTIQRVFYREKTQEKIYDDRSGKNDFVTVREEIAPGTPVAVGDKIIAEYHIWNQENRSFVRVDAFREAALRPVEQLSGRTGWGWWRGRSLTYAPQGYRNVKADRTEYYFDSFPEENTTISEEFFVTQAGTFTAPVITIVSLYAPHYRANDAFHGVLAVE